VKAAKQLNMCVHMTVQQCSLEIRYASLSLGVGMVCSHKHHLRLRNYATSDIFRVRQDATYVTWNLRNKFLLIICIIN
jgi:hypothetical protein